MTFKIKEVFSPNCINITDPFSDISTWPFYTKVFDHGAKATENTFFWFLPDLFRSPPEKRYELTIICQYECSEWKGNELQVAI